jgi:hypothetical protein
VYDRVLLGVSVGAGSPAPAGEPKAGDEKICGGLLVSGVFSPDGR